MISPSRGACASHSLSSRRSALPYWRSPIRSRPRTAAAAVSDPPESSIMLSDEDLERYARQAIMPDIGEEGQARLLESRMLVVGAGGLGSPTIFYLAAAGVGNLTIMDGESVDLTNLNRQILHTTFP